MNDWKTLDPQELEAGEAGNRLIAEAAGWHIAKMGRIAMLLRSDGSPGQISKESGIAQGGVESAIHVEHAHKDEILWGYVDRFTESVDAALSLLETTALDIELETENDRRGVWAATVGWRASGSYGITKSWADTPALAICRTWLVWKQEQEHNE